jgi:hypothetical protein
MIAAALFYAQTGRVIGRVWIDYLDVPYADSV